ncbi:GNAT family N-acetyltransferase [Aliikangiella coralliicola]|uniref:GNAT family N-acetyltransferase n=1 Tax=Aliikangiella coralliicola TaxID=2592383 RepID=A0A545UGC4_9GAMM|nr:GNAT family N-acetyltransferase [Aliikangiella coralliicola]TQV88485.1 GNAT family N-acetyltransferase [Aliikangiella coralliicola]
MKLEIREYDKELTSELMDLLLTADPDKDKVIAYFTGSTVLVAQEENAIVGIAILSRNLDKEFELKNIAVLKDYQGKGIAKLLIAAIQKLAKEKGAKTLDVGTGNSSLAQLALYQKCGFRLHSIEHDFFSSYPEPIYENGIRCLDMVRLRIEL